MLSTQGTACKVGPEHLVQLNSCKRIDGELAKTPTTKPTIPNAMAPMRPWFSHPNMAPNTVAMAITETVHTTFVVLTNPLGIFRSLLVMAGPEPNYFQPYRGALVVFCYPILQKMHRPGCGWAVRRIEIRRIAALVSADMPPHQHVKYSGHRRLNSEFVARPRIGQSMLS